MIYASGEKHVYLNLLNRGEQFLKYIEVNLKMEHVPPCAISLKFLKCMPITKVTNVLYMAVMFIIYSAAF